MGFDINKYDNVTFSTNDLTNKRIKALLLWFEHEVDKNNLSLDSQIELLELWLKRLLKEELYEVLPFFKQKLTDIKEQKLNEPIQIIEPTVIITNESTANLSEDIKITPKESFLMRVKSKIKKFLNYGNKRI